MLPSLPPSPLRYPRPRLTTVWGGNGAKPRIGQSLWPDLPVRSLSTVTCVFLVQVKPVRDPSASLFRILPSLSNSSFTNSIHQLKLRHIINHHLSTFASDWKPKKMSTRKRKNDEELVALPSDSEGEEEEEWVPSARVCASNSIKHSSPGHQLEAHESQLPQWSAKPASEPQSHVDVPAPRGTWLRLDPRVLMAHNTNIHG